MTESNRLNYRVVHPIVHCTVLRGTTPITALTALLALGTSLLWGLADFGGGLPTRRFPALTVVGVSQGVAVLALALVLVLVLGTVVLATGALGEAGPLLWYAVAAVLARNDGPLRRDAQRSSSARAFSSDSSRAASAASCCGVTPSGSGVGAGVRRGGCQPFSGS